MRDKREFFAILKSIDGQQAAEYGRLKGDFDFSRYVLHNVKIPPLEEGRHDVLFAVHVPQLIAGFPDRVSSSPIRRTALEDFLARQAVAEIDRLTEATRTEFAPDRISMARPGSIILPRSSVVVSQDYVEARLTVRMPLRDGLVCADEALRVFFHDIPQIVNRAFVYCNLDEARLQEFVDQMEDADEVRQSLFQKNLVAFIGEGSRLPQVGACGQALTHTPPIEVEASLQTRLEVTHAGQMTGLTIPMGITLILGDAYSGRMELLDALASGIYNHVPGDGRENVITVPDAVQVVAEKHRAVQRVDLRAFFSDIPGMETASFSTKKAAPAEAQAASLIEALQAGAQALIIDESSSDPAFLTAAACLHGLGEEYGKRVTPLAARVQELKDHLNVSLIVGASACAAEFVPMADKIYLIDRFRVRDVTKEAKESGVLALPKPPAQKADLAAVTGQPRWIIPSSIDPSEGVNDFVIEAVGAHDLRFGRAVINLRGLRQIGDPAQTATIGLILYYAKLRYLDESRSLPELLDLIDHDIGSEGLDTLSREMRGDLARPRRYEIAAALNRLQSLRVTHESTGSRR